MSITKDFEKGEHGFKGWIEKTKALLAHARSIEAQNEELKAEVKRLSECFEFQTGVAVRSIEEIGKLKAMLRKLNNGFYECPICRSPPLTRLGNGHSPDCTLAKLIGE